MKKLPIKDLQTPEALSGQLQCRLPSFSHRFQAASSHGTENLNSTSYISSLSHLLVDQQLMNHICCQHRLPWLWLSWAKGEERQPAEDESHRGDVHPEESFPDWKSSRVCFFHRRNRKERNSLFDDHRPLVGCNVQLRFTWQLG